MIFSKTFLQIGKSDTAILAKIYEANFSVSVENINSGINFDCK